MADPKNQITGERGDIYAPGQQADGSINSMTVEEALKALGQREADEEAFAQMLDGEDLDDVDDLDDEDESEE